MKSEFYEIYGAGFKSLCVGSERDLKKHGQMKRLLSTAFWPKALAEQENIVQNALDQFIYKIGQNAEIKAGLNMVEWLEMIAFEVFGEMGFGESFCSVEKGLWSRVGIVVF